MGAAGTFGLVADGSRRFSRVERETIRRQIDEAQRQAHRLRYGRPAAGSKGLAVEEVAGVLGAHPNRLFSRAEIARALGFNDPRVLRALLILQREGRAEMRGVSGKQRWVASQAKN